MNIDELQKSDKIIFSCIAGSHAYGLSVPESDIDLRGIFYNKPEVSLIKPSDQIMDKTNDTVFYSVEEFFKLIMNASPNMVELLFIDDEHIQVHSPAMQYLYQNRSQFLSTKCLYSFSGYAHNQIKKARGKNKMVHNPQPTVPPNPRDYLYFASNYKHSPMPMRPARMTETSGFRVSHMEHGFNCYRAYAGTKDDDFFKDGYNIVCSSIPKDEEHMFQGLVQFNQTEYDNAKRNHKQYWNWVDERNDSRWITQESGEMDYDCKSMLHCMRLMLSGINVLENGEPIVKFKGEQQELLMNIRKGKFTYDELMEMVEDRKDYLDSLKDKSELPQSINHKEMNTLYKTTMQLCKQDDL